MIPTKHARIWLRNAVTASVIGLVAWLGHAATGEAAYLYASGQLLIEGEPGHDDVRENRIFKIDVLTGKATAVSPLFDGATPAALAGRRKNGQPELLGIRSGRLGKVNISEGTFLPIGDPIGMNSTGFDILADGRGYIVPFVGSQTPQLFSIDLETAMATPIGSSTAIGDAIDAALGNNPGTTQPFVISLGSVGSTLYGVDLRTNTLIALDPETGTASVVGQVGAVGSSQGGGYSGCAALTGVDTNGDGAFDSLYGVVNFAPGGERLGGIARYDLNDGTWSLVGTNPGMIFFGMGSTVVPEPSSVVMLGMGLVGGWVVLRRSRKLMT